MSTPVTEKKMLLVFCNVMLYFVNKKICIKTSKKYVTTPTP